MAGSIQPNVRRIAVGSTATACVAVTTHEVSVQIDGDVDLANGGQLLETLVALLVDHQPSRMSLDLSPLAFVDGAGRRALRQFMDRAHQNRVRVSLIAPAIWAVRMSLEVGGLRFDDEPDEGAGA